MEPSQNDFCDDTTRFDDDLHEDNLNKADPELWLLDVQKERLELDENAPAVGNGRMPPEPSFTVDKNNVGHHEQDVPSEQVVTTTVRRYPASPITGNCRVYRNNWIANESHVVGATVVNNTILVDAEQTEQSKNVKVLRRVICFVLFGLAFISATTITAVMKIKEKRSTVILPLPTNAPSQIQFEHVAIMRSPNQTIADGYIEFQQLNRSEFPLDMLAGGPEYLALINRTSLNMTVFGLTKNGFSEFMSNTDFIIKAINKVWYAHAVSKTG